MEQIPKPYALRCEFKFECPKKWETLTPTPVANVRHCDHCKKDVTLALNNFHLAELTVAGACVAVIWGKREWGKRTGMRIGLPRTKDGGRSFTDNL